MVKIDVSKVLGSHGYSEAASSKASLLPQFSISNARSRISRLSPRTLWTLLFTAVFLQSLICWRIFFPPKASYILGPPYNSTETVALITEWYEVLQDMRYLGKDAIAYPPHVDHNGDSAINVTLARDFGLDERVIETMLRMPYVKVSTSTDEQQEKDSWSGWMGDRGILWRNGHFVDYRNEEDLWLALDPLLRADHSFAREEAAEMTLREQIIELEALPKSVIPLSAVRNPSYALVLLLDVATNRILVYDTQGGGANSDPFFGSAWDTTDETPFEYRIPGRFYGMENIYARLAPNVLREFISKLVSLETGYVPGSVRTDEHYTPELSPPKWEQWVQDLYYEYGWPSAEAIEDCAYPPGMYPREHNATCTRDLLGKFNASGFSEKMADLRHDIAVRYRQDWYCPVPRDPEVIGRLQNSLHGLTQEQLAYAKSDAPVIPLDLKGWGGSLIWQASWDFSE